MAAADLEDIVSCETNPGGSAQTLPLSEDLVFSVCSQTISAGGNTKNLSAGTEEIPAEYFPIFTLLPSPACQLYVLYKQIKGVLLSCRILLAGRV